MKKLLAIIVLSLCFITPSQADDIRDFQVAGISVGDSLLDYYNKKEINKAFVVKTGYPSDDKKFYEILLPDKELNKFEALQFALKTSDNNYKIYQLVGKISYEKKFKECMEEKEKIKQEILSITKNSKMEAYTSNYGKTMGKSKAYITHYFLPNGSIRIWCTKLGKKYKKEKSKIDRLSVSVSSEEFRKWLIEVYK